MRTLAKARRGGYAGMTMDETQQPAAHETASDRSDGMAPTTTPRDAAVASRRTLLRLGSIGAVAVVTVRPAMAQTAVSVINCQIPVPDARAGGQYVAADGTLVPAGTPGAFAPAPQPFTGEQVKRAMQHQGLLPGTSYDQSDAYMRYIQRLQAGQGGFTCFASLMTR